MPSDRCPEPKPVAIFFLTLAGAAGGAAQYFLFEGGGALWLLFDAAIGGGVGLAIGTSIAVSRKSWIQMAIAPVFGFIGALVGLAVFESLTGGLDLDLLVRTQFDRGVLFGSPMAFALVSAHALFLKWKWSAAPCYLIFGAACVWFYSLRAGTEIVLLYRSTSGTSFSLREHEGLLAAAIFAGAAFGLLQLLGLLAAQAVERKTSRADHSGL